MFQITVDLKSLQIKIAITNFVLIVTKYQFKMVFQKFKILKNIFFDKILSDPFTLQLTAGIKLSNSELLKYSMASRQIQGMSFHLIAIINQLTLFVNIIVIILSMYFIAHYTKQDWSILFNKQILYLCFPKERGEYYRYLLGSKSKTLILMVNSEGWRLSRPPLNNHYDKMWRHS